MKATFVPGSAICGGASTINILMAGRAVQGILASHRHFRECVEVHVVRSNCLHRIIVIVEKKVPLIKELGTEYGSFREQAK